MHSPAPLSRRTSLRLRLFSLAAAALTAGAGIASAASPTWAGPNIGAANTTVPFENAAYWSTGVVPGSTTTTGPFTNTDTAIFNATLSTSTSAFYNISVTGSRNLGSIFFDNTSTRYAIIGGTGGSLLLTSGGNITNNNTTVTQYVSVPLVLEPSGGTTSNGSYTLINNGSKIVYQGASIIGGATSGTVNLTLGGTISSLTGSGQLVAPISDGSATGGVSVTKTGLGSWTITRTVANATVNTYTGPTRVNSGILYVDFANAENGFSNTSPTSNLIANSALQLAGGTIYMAGQAATPNSGVTGTAGVATSQTFQGTTLISGTSSTATAAVSAANGTGAAVTLNLGALTRQTGSTVAFNLPTAGAITTTTANNSGGTLGGYAVINSSATNINSGNTWAANDGSGNIIALPAASYTTTATAGTTAANYANVNLDVTGSTAPAAGITPNTIRFNTAATAGNGLTLTLTGANVVNSGGILVTSTVGVGTGNTTATVINSTITGGTLTSGNGQDLVVIQNDVGGSSAIATIGSVITDNGATSIGLTKAGTGDLVLSAANTYTGATYVDGGRLRPIVANALPTGTALVFASSQFANNATLANTTQGPAFALGGIATTVASLSGATDNIANGYTLPVVFGNGGATRLTFTINGSASTTFGGVIGDSNSATNTVPFQSTAQPLAIAKAGSSTLTLTAPNVYSGGTTISGTGAIYFNNATGTGSGQGSITVAAGSTLGGSGILVPVLTGNSGTTTSTLTINGNLAPGPAAGSIGILTLSAAGATRTAGTPLLTFASGSTMSITLGAGLTASSLALTSAYTGEVSFNGTTINFTTAGALNTGLYTLVSADAAGAYTGLTTTGNQITGGLTVGSGLAGQTYDLELNGNNIQLNITAVPEPTEVAQIAIFGLLGLGAYLKHRHAARRA